MKPIQVVGVLLVLGFGVSSYLRNRPEKAVDATYTTVTKPAFVVTLPDWKVTINEGSPGLGKYQVKSKSNNAMAEVSWQGGSPTTQEDMVEMSNAIVAGFGMQTKHESSDESVLGESRYHIVATLEGKAWIAMSFVNCEATNVLVTLGLTARSRDDAEFMSKKALASFQCTGAGPENFQGIKFAAVSLDDSFGQYVDGESLTLANQEGHVIIIFGGTTADFSEAQKHPQKILSVYGELMEMEIKKTGGTRNQKSKGGTDQWLVSATLGDTNQPLVLGGFVCPELTQGFMSIALSESAEADVALLDNLIAHIDCPTASTKDVLKRKSACEVGAKEYCE